MALNSKRMQTFFNEFLITTTSYLNLFANDCEKKFFEFERKLNRIESNLIIIESKLASVPCEIDSVDAKSPPETKIEVKVEQQIEQQKSTEILSEIPHKTEDDQPQQQTKEEQITEQQQPIDSNLIKISESFLYKKFFKMLKFGVPEPAVRIKMAAEGLDGSLISNPDLMIEKQPEDDEEVVE